MLVDDDSYALSLRFAHGRYPQYGVDMTGRIKSYKILPFGVRGTESFILRYEKNTKNVRNKCENRLNAQRRPTKRNVRVQRRSRYAMGRTRSVSKLADVVVVVSDFATRRSLTPDATSYAPRNDFIIVMPRTFGREKVRIIKHRYTRVVLCARVRLN